MTPTGPELVATLKREDTNSTNPALTTAGATAALIGLVYFVIRQFVPGISDEVLNQWSTALSPIIVILLGFLIRSKVWSPSSVKTVVAQSVINAKNEQIQNVNLHETRLKDKEPHPYIKPTPPTTKDFDDTHG